MNQTFDKPRRPRTAQQVALEELREAILTGRLAPGSPVLQELVAGELGLSRVPVREALKMLEGEGLVTYEAHRGYVVTKLTPLEVKEVYRIRELLEDEAVSKAAKNLDRSDIEKMVALNEKLAKAYQSGDLLDILTTNRQFHDVIFAKGGTQKLQKLINVMWDSIESYRSSYFINTENHAELLEEHNKIIQAAAAGDTKDLLRLTRLHRSRAYKVIARLAAEQSAS